MQFKRADQVEVGDIVDGRIVTESRPYLPNPDVMWLIVVRSPFHLYFNKRSDPFGITPGITIHEHPLDGI